MKRAKTDIGFDRNYRSSREADSLRTKPPFFSATCDGSF